MSDSIIGWGFPPRLLPHSNPPTAFGAATVYDRSCTQEECGPRRVRQMNGVLVTGGNWGTGQYTAVGHFGGKWSNHLRL